MFYSCHKNSTSHTALHLLQVEVEEVPSDSPTPKREEDLKDRTSSQARIPKRTVQPLESGTRRKSSPLRAVHNGSVRRAVSNGSVQSDASAEDSRERFGGRKPSIHLSYREITPTTNKQLRDLISRRNSWFFQTWAYVLMFVVVSICCVISMGVPGRRVASIVNMAPSLNQVSRQLSVGILFRGPLRSQTPRKRIRVAYLSSFRDLMSGSRRRVVAGT
jgi:hypothetical protein